MGLSWRGKEELKAGGGDMESAADSFCWDVGSIGQTSINRLKRDHDARGSRVSARPLAGVLIDFQARRGVAQSDRCLLRHSSPAGTS